MKIAICLFGNLRTFKQCSNSLEQHVSSINECDIFIHTWSSLNHSTQTWHKNNSPENSLNVNLQIDCINECYRPKKLLIEDQKVQNLGHITSVKRKISILVFMQ